MGKSHLWRVLVEVVEVWNSARKKCYAYSSFVMLDDVLYPLFWFWCGGGSTGFITLFCFENLAEMFFKSRWLEMVSPLLKLLLVSVPGLVIVKGNPSSQNLISRWIAGTMLEIESVVTIGGHNDFPWCNLTVCHNPWLYSIILTCDVIGGKQ